jgi:hypothetical protein
METAERKIIWQPYESWFPESDPVLDEYAEVLTRHCDLGVCVCVCVIYFS